MPKKIRWSPDAENDMGLILNYLSKEWKSSVSANFLDIVEDVVNQISLKRFYESMIVDKIQAN